MLKNHQPEYVQLQFVFVQPTLGWPFATENMVYSCFLDPHVDFFMCFNCRKSSKIWYLSIPNVSPWYLLPWNECFCPSAYCQNTDHGPVCVGRHITSHLFDLIDRWLAGKPTTDQMIYLSSAHPWNTIGFVSIIRWYLVPYPGVNIDAEKNMEKTMVFLGDWSINGGFSTHLCWFTRG